MWKAPLRERAFLPSGGRRWCLNGSSAPRRTRPFTGLAAGQRRLTFVDAQDNAEEVPVEEQELYSGEVEDMHDAILDGRPPYLGVDETRNHVRTVLALYESARRGERVFVEEIS